MRSECVEWHGARTHNGYGRIRVGPKTKRAHRVAWELANGPIPSDMIVCHRCDNPPCVNVDHLFLSTHQGNMTDMVTKGRSLAGDNHPLRRNPSRAARGDSNGARRYPKRGVRASAAKLTATQVEEIRAILEAAKSLPLRHPSRISQEAVGRMYGLCQSAISSILRRASYS